MSKATPSLLALLGLVAVAGYQNRGRISEMLEDARRQGSSGGPGPDRQQAAPQGDASGGGFLSEIGNLFGAGSAGTTLSQGLGELVNRFRETGRPEPADSWVSTQTNRPLDVRELEEALGDDTLDELARKTGLSRRELLLRLNTALPEVVDRFTPEGRVPTEDEARRFD